MSTPKSFASAAIARYKYGSIRPGVFGGEPKRHHEGTLPRALAHWQAYSTRGGDLTLANAPSLLPGVGEGWTLVRELYEAVTQTPEDRQQEALDKAVNKALLQWRQRYLALVNGPERPDSAYKEALDFALAICDRLGVDDRGLRQWAS